MTGIYSAPVQYPKRPENAMRARDGLRPLCFDRPDFPDLMGVQRGLELVELATPEVATAAVFVPAFDLVPNPMTKDCKAWSVHPDEDPATESVPGLEHWRCHGCRHLPPDPRVFVRAAASELW